MTRRDLAAAIVLSSVLAFVAGFATARASRPALDPIPAPLSVTAETGPGGTAIGGFPVLDSKGKTGPEQAGTPDGGKATRGQGRPASVLSGGSSPSGEPSAEVRGIASHVGRQFGRLYLALPEHRWGQPGITVTIRGAGGSVIRTSTDAGPALFRQRQGRVADLNAWDFEKVCGLPWTAGLCRVTVDYGPVYLPATDGR